jgi:hypothetical protein
VTDQKDLKHLCEVSKSLQFLITPILYKSITVHAESEAFLEDIEVHPFMRICYNPTNLLQFVEAIEFTSRFCSRIQDRCIHNKLQYELDEDSSVDEEEEEGNSIMARLVNSVLPLLEKLSDGGLRNFA